MGALLLQWPGAGSTPRRPPFLRLGEAALCGEGGAEPAAADAWRRRARDVEARLAQGRSAEVLAEAGLVRLAAGDAKQAIALFSESQALRSDACTLIALSAAHLLAAEADDAPPAHLLAALGAAGRAALLDPAALEAFANEARARERLGLRLSAAAAWRHAGRNAAPAATPADPVVALRQAADAGDWDGLARLARLHREAARLFGEEDRLPRVAGGAPAGADPLAAAGVVGDTLAASGGDALLADTVRAVRAATGERRARTVAGLARLREGLGRTRRDEWPEAAEALGSAHDLLRQAGNPYAEAVTLQRAVALYYVPRYADALGLTLGVSSGRYPALDGRAEWLRGLMLLVRGRPLEALQAHRRAALAYARLAERGHGAFVSILMAGDLEAIHRPREAWACRRDALLALDDVHEPRRLY